MGYVQFSMPRNLVTKFQQSGNLKNFIETGTFKGATAFWAAGVFEFSLGSRTWGFLGGVGSFRVWKVHPSVPARRIAKPGKRTHYD